MAFSIIEDMQYPRL